MIDRKKHVRVPTVRVAKIGRGPSAVWRSGVTLVRSVIWRQGASGDNSAIKTGNIDSLTKSLCEAEPIRLADERGGTGGH